MALDKTQEENSWLKKCRFFNKQQMENFFWIKRFMHQTSLFWNKTFLASDLWIAAASPDLTITLFWMRSWWQVVETKMFQAVQFIQNHILVMMVYYWSAATFSDYSIYANKYRFSFWLTMALPFIYVYV